MWTPSGELISHFIILFFYFVLKMSFCQPWSLCPLCSLITKFITYIVLFQIMAVRLFRPLIQTGRAFAVSRQKAAIIQPHTFAAFHASTARFNENIINIQDVDDFTDRVVKSSVPVIIDFHAG